jgi:hypothetical protein
MNLISASAVGPRTRGMTLKGWPALGDVYCHVERRRSWTGFKLLHQRAGAAGPASIPQPRHRPHQDPMPAARAASQDTQGRPGIKQDAQGGSRSGSSHLSLDSSLTPTYLALVPSERLCPRDRGTPTRAQHPYPGGVRGPSPRRPHHRPGRRRLSRPAPAAQRSHPVGPGQPCLGPAPARRDWPRETRGGRLGRRRTSEQDGPQPKSGYGTKPARRPRPRGKEAVPDGQGGRHRFLHPDPISGSNPPTRITAATGPPLKRPPGPGSHRDGPEACSPGEVRAGARSLDGRGRGESTITKYGSEHSLRVGHHVQGPGTEAPAAAAR